MEHSSVAEAKRTNPKKSKHKICEDEGCIRRAVCGFKNGKRLRCKVHALGGMTQNWNNLCIFEGCKKRASYANTNERAQYCAAHKSDSMLMRRTLCSETECTTIPFWGYPGHQPTKCATHKVEGMEPKYTLCEVADCKKQPSWGVPESGASRCGSHKVQGMVAKGQLCSVHFCDKRPSYRSANGVSCASHKVEGMWRINECNTPGCDKVPSYGLDRSLYCVAHRLVGMKDWRSTKCEVEGCDIQASFKFVGQRAVRCCDHQLLGMVSMCKSCVVPDCVGRATKGITKNTHCSLHASIGMTDLNRYLCEVDGCEVVPNYGLPGHRAHHCVVHKQEGETRIKYRTCTAVHNCRDIPLFGRHYAERCEGHRLVSDMNLAERKCEDCGLFEILMGDNKCRNCSSFLDVQKRGYLEKQRHVQGFLDRDAGLCEYDFSDRMFAVTETGSCVRYRPDFLWDVGTHVVILEIDEDQHQTYEELCECVRMRNIAECIMRPTVFIRYNPDSVKIDGETRKISYKTRMAELRRWILFLKAKRLEGGILYVVHLYYDNMEATVNVLA